MGKGYVGPVGPMPDYSKDEGARIRALLMDNPQWVESALLEMGADPVIARNIGQGGVDPEMVTRYLEATKASRAERRNAAARRRTKATPAPRLPWAWPE